MSDKKWHINEEGRVLPCSASKKECEFSEHFTNVGEARSRREEILEKENPVWTVVRKNKNELPSHTHTLDAIKVSVKPEALNKFEKIRAALYRGEMPDISNVKPEEVSAAAHFKLYAQTLRDLAQSSGGNPRMYRSLVDINDYTIDSYLAQNDSTPILELERIARRSRENRFRISASLRTYKNIEIKSPERTSLLGTLFKDKSPEIRIAAIQGLQSTNATLEFQSVLSEDEDEDVRANFAAFGAMGPKIYAKMLKDSSPKVRKAMAFRPDMRDLEVVELLCKDKDEKVSATARMRKMTLLSEARKMESIFS